MSALRLRTGVLSVGSSLCIRGAPQRATYLAPRRGKGWSLRLQRRHAVTPTRSPPGSRILDNERLWRKSQFIFQEDFLGFLEKTGTLLAGAAAKIGIPVRQHLQLSADFAAPVYNRRISLYRCFRTILCSKNWLQIEIRECAMRKQERAHIRCPDYLKVFPKLSKPGPYCCYKPF